MQLTENTTFANRYHLLRLLGRGGFSEVWLAKDSLTDLEIALKVYAPGTGMDEDGLKTFSKELAAVYDLNHGNLLKPQHVDSWQGMPYLVMSYCSQGSLVKRIGKMSEGEIWKVLHDVASGLAYLHERDIVHQDIKPDNILVDNAGNYVITDFGISTRARSTLRKSVAASSANSGGTIAYMGPERFGKEPTPIKASDIWSLGAMLFELMTGNTPFGEHGGLIQKSGAEIPVIHDDYSNRLKSMVEKMLSQEPWNRPTAAELAEGKVVTMISDSLVVDEPTERSNHATMPIAEIASTVTPSLAETQSIRTSHSLDEQSEKDAQQSSDNHVNSNGNGKSTLWIILALVICCGIGIAFFISNQKAEQEKVCLELAEAQRQQAKAEEDARLVREHQAAIEAEANRKVEEARIAREKQAVQQKMISSEHTEKKSHRSVIDDRLKPSGQDSGHDWVDLGLSVKWATCNIGATSPEKYGYYIAWGETQPKKSYSLSTYKYYNGSDDTMTKYCTDSRWGTVDNRTVLESIDDAATINWGSSWRIPTKSEWEELRDNCSWTWTKINGVNGYCVSASNGNSIFLPLAGIWVDLSCLQKGRDGYYRSASLYESFDSHRYESNNMAYYFYLNSPNNITNFGWSRNDRYFGESIRPVHP